MGRTSRTTKGGRMKRLSDNAIAIVNELHTERLDYESEYVPIIDALNRLAEYEDMEEQGLLVWLPCKAGDTIYRCGDPIKKIYEWQIAYVEVYEDETVFVDDSDNTFVEADIGKTVFLTREEAEKALED